MKYLLGAMLILLTGCGDDSKIAENEGKEIPRVSNCGMDNKLFCYSCDYYYVQQNLIVRACIDEQRGIGF